MKVFSAFLFVSAVLLPGTVSAQAVAPARSPLVGAWKIVQNANGPVSQPSLYVFTARHYSRMSTAGDKARVKFKDGDPAKATAAEKLAAYDTFAANTGTYEISGNVVVLKVILAKSPNRPDDRLQFKVEGASLTLTDPQTKAVTRLTRVE